MAKTGAGAANGDRLLTYWPFDEGRGTTVTEAVSGDSMAIEHVPDGATDESGSVPRWPDGIVGTGLLFDGYSTWIERDEPLCTTKRRQMTVEAWIAPRSFPGGSCDGLAAVISDHDSGSNRGFTFGVSGHGRLSFKVGTGDRWCTVQADESLPKYEWSYVIGMFDGSAGEMTLYRDGERVARTSIPTGESMAPADGPLFVGRSSEPDRVGGVFVRNAFAGAVDELRISADALSLETIRQRYRSYRQECDGELPPADYETIGLDPKRYEEDPHRPKYHPIPPGHWMNEPHAPLYYDGKYHLFYQHNPSGPYWGNIHWGHWVSEDLVHWRQLQPALAPEADGIVPDGIWSGGSTLDDDGLPVLFFTAGDMSTTPDQSVATARPVDPADPDLTEWTTADESLLEQPQAIGLRENDFRDPYVWREDETWYCLVGSGVESGGGRALLYESTGLDEWQFRGSLYEADYDEYPELGQVWELPVLLPLGTDDHGDRKHVFIISPIGGAADVEVYYWIGDWNPADGRFDPDHEEPRLIDYGDFHFTGPHGFVDPETERSILFTIAQDNRHPQDHHDSGWAHNGGLPVELFLRDDGTLGINPIDELTSLRSRSLISIEDEQSGSDRLDGVGGDTIEIRAKLSTDGADRYGLKIRNDSDGPEETLVYYDTTDERIYVHREHSTRDPRRRAEVSARSSLVHSGPVSLDGGSLDLHVYIDKSMLEVYANQRKSVTTRIYPVEEHATEIELWNDGPVSIDQLDVWELESVYDA